MLGPPPWVSIVEIAGLKRRRAASVTVAATKGAFGLQPIRLNHQSTPLHLPAMEDGNGILALRQSFHLHEAETTVLPIVQISDDLG